MERRVLLAAILSGLVIVVWYAVFGRTDHHAGPGRATFSGAGGNGRAPLRRPRKPPRRRIPEAPAVNARPACDGTDEALVTLEVEGLRATVSPQGRVSDPSSSPAIQDSKGSHWSCWDPGSEAPTLAAEGPGTRSCMPSSGRRAQSCCAGAMGREAGSRSGWRPGRGGSA